MIQNRAAIIFNVMEQSMKQVVMLPSTVVENTLLQVNTDTGDSAYKC